MTISSTTRLAGPFIGTGVSVPSFPFTFKVFLTSDILVVVSVGGVQTTLTLTSDYSVALNGDQDGSPGGTITLNPATTTPAIIGGILPVGAMMVGSSQVPQLQATALTNFGGFFPTVINAALDRLTILIQQVQQLLGRGITVPITDTQGLNLQLPLASARALQALLFDAFGNVITGALPSVAVSSPMIPVVQAASLAVARTALGLGSIAAQNANAVVISGGSIDGTPIGATTPSTAKFITSALGDASQNAATAAFVGQNMVGGFINKFRNPSFDIWQRGTSLTVVNGTPAYTADGWIVSTTGANATVAKNNIFDFGTFSAMQITGNTSMTDTLVKQRIESVVAAQLFANGSSATSPNLTVQFMVQNNTGASITPTLTVKHAGGIDNWSSPVTDVNAVSLQPVANGATSLVAYTFAPASNTIFGLEVTLDFGAALSSNAKNVQIVFADIRATPGVAVGLNSTPPQAEFRHIQAELAFCQRYLPAYQSTTASVSPIGMGIETNGSGSSGFVQVAFGTPPRIPPTGVTVSSAGHFQVIQPGTATATLTGLTFSSASVSSVLLAFTDAGGLTSALPLLFESISASAQLLFTGAEL